MGVVQNEVGGGVATNIENQETQIPVVIVGGGITGLSLAAKLAQHEIPFLLLEAADRLGGQIRTGKKAGFVFETGPNTGTISNPEVVELFQYADCPIEIAKPAAKSRWIWKKDRFHALPASLFSAITTPLFTWKDKFRILGEPFRKPGNNPNESVGALATRRLGKSFVDYAVDPFIGGIYAGDPFKLVTKWALPKLYRLEAEHGSFIKGTIAKAKQPKTEREKLATKEIFSAPGGLQTLVDKLGEKLASYCAANPGEILTGAKIQKVEYLAPNRWQVTYQTSQGAKTVVASHFVSTIRADLLPELLPAEITDSPAGLSAITSLDYAPVAEVAVGFNNLPQIQTDAFGGLIPSKESRKILGILFPSGCFANRVPGQDAKLFTIFVGGLRGKETYRLPDPQLLEVALGELYDMLNIPTEIQPDMVELTRYPKAIAQYDDKSEARINRIAELEEQFVGLQLAGAIRDGIGLAHRITQGSQIGQLLANQLGKA